MAAQMLVNSLLWKSTETRGALSLASGEFWLDVNETSPEWEWYHGYQGGCDSVKMYPLKGTKYHCTPRALGRLQLPILVYSMAGNVRTHLGNCDLKHTGSPLVLVYHLRTLSVHSSVLTLTVSMILCAS